MNKIKGALIMILICNLFLPALALAAPNPPSNLTSGGTSLTAIKLQWNDNSTDEEFFKIERKLHTDTAWQYLGQVAGSTNSLGFYDDSSAAASITYDYQVSACIMNQGCSDPSNVFTTVRLNDSGGTISTVPNAPSNVHSAAAPTQNSITIAWNDNSTDETKFNIMRKDVNSSTAFVFIYQPGANATSYTDNGLTPGKTYQYSVEACHDGVGCSAAAYSENITTASALDTQPPTWSTGSFTAVTSTSQVILYWAAATDNVGVAGYNVYRDDQLISTVSINTYTDHNVSPGTTYHYYIKAFDAAQNLSGQTPVMTVTIASTSTPSSDTIAPTVPNSLTTVQVSSRQVKLNWGASTDNIGISYYTIYRNGNAIGNSSIPGYTDSSVSPSSNYYYSVRAFDAAGNKSQSTSDLFVTTPGESSSSTSTVSSQDTTPPSIPSNVKATINTNNVAISWNASSDNIGVAGYRIFRNGTQIGTTSSVSGIFYYNFFDYQITAGAAYNYYVVAYDAQNNSTQSGYASANIPLPVTTPTTTPTTTVQVESRFQGYVTDNTGVPVANAIISVWNTAKNIYGYQTANSNGFYTVPVPPGSYQLLISPPSDRTDLSRPGATTIAIGENEIRTVSIVIPKIIGQKTLRGTLSFAGGSIVPNAQVTAFNSETSQWMSVVPDSSGNFIFNLSSGSWVINVISMDLYETDWSPDGLSQTVVFSGSSDETKNIAITINKNASKISVHLRDENSGSVANAGVSIEPKNQTSASNRSPLYSRTDVNGNITFTLNPGSYIVRSFLPSDSGLLSPPAVPIELKTGDDKKIEMVFKNKPAENSLIRGTAVLQDGTPIADAYIFAWSGGGAVTDLHTDSNGNFSIESQANDVWHLGATKEIGGSLFRSAENAVKVGVNAAIVKLTLLKISTLETTPVVVSSTPSTDTVVSSASGASVLLAAGTASPSSGSITVKLSPTVETPSRVDTRVLGPAYDIKVTDGNGTALTTFQNDIQISLPFNKALLNSFGVNENSIKPSYFDESTGAWVRINNYTVNKQKNTIDLRVRHLTRFALVAPADTVPPAPPSKIIAYVNSPGIVTLAWVNPKADFHHVKIYRSEKSNSQGTLLNDLVFVNTFKDKATKKIYYYTLKTVDASGNESKEVKKISINLSKTTSIPAGLKKGNKKDAVSLLQLALIKSGQLKNTFEMNNTFDTATFNAVKAFQTKNKIKATGNIDAKSAAALNKILQKI